uniref:Uncharacterized protein n=1 Tax=Oryza brachyantha TaxID=4533 RepID=J3N0P4_ORYBR
MARRLAFAHPHQRRLLRVRSGKPTHGKAEGDEARLTVFLQNSPKQEKLTLEIDEACRAGLMRWQPDTLSQYNSISSQEKATQNSGTPRKRCGNTISIGTALDATAYVRRGCGCFRNQDRWLGNAASALRSDTEIGLGDSGNAIAVAGVIEAGQDATKVQRALFADSVGQAATALYLVLFS